MTFLRYKTQIWLHINLNLVMIRDSISQVQRHMIACKKIFTTDGSLHTLHHIYKNSIDGILK